LDQPSPQRKQESNDLKTAAGRQRRRIDLILLSCEVEKRLEREDRAAQQQQVIYYPREQIVVVFSLYFAPSLVTKLNNGPTDFMIHCRWLFSATWPKFILLILCAGERLLLLLLFAGIC